MARLVSLQGFADEIKVELKKAKSILRHNPEIGVKIKGYRAKMIDMTYWEKVTKKAING